MKWYQRLTRHEALSWREILCETLSLLIALAYLFVLIATLRFYIDVLWRLS